MREIVAGNKLQKPFLIGLDKFRLLLLVIAMQSLILTGCNDEVVWFDFGDEEEILAVEPSKMEKDFFYVKNGTKFYKTYRPVSGSGLTASASSRGDRVIGLLGSEEYQVPNHYLGEILAYSSDKILLNSITLERYEDMGYSVGVYGTHFDEDGYLIADDGIIKDSVFQQYIAANKGELRIISINGEKVTPEMVDMESGIILGLEKDALYKIGMMFGTYYKEYDIKADVHMLKSFEFFEYDQDSIQFTQNGYVSFAMAKNMKSGFYWVNGSGLYRYFDFKKGDEDEELASMNDPFYANEQERLAASSKQFSVSLKTKVKDLKISVPVPTSETNAVGYVFSPEGNKYVMTYDDDQQELSLSLTQAMLGTWTVNIMPKSLDIDQSDIKVESTVSDEEATLDEKTFVFDEDITNMVFDVLLDGEGEAYGYVQDSDGEVHDLVFEEERFNDIGHNRLYYEMPYMKAGEYTIKVYHHPLDTTIVDMQAHQNVKVETDTIIITE